MHDPLSVADLVHDEIRQRRESGYEVDPVLVPATPPEPGVLEDLYRSVLGTRRSPGWPYREPDAWDELTREWPPTGDALVGAARPSGPDLADRLYGGWLGRIAGCQLGKPIEDGEHWTPARIRSYLERAGAFPLRDYLPVLEPMPAQYRLRECWPETTRGRIDGAARDDDIDYSILALMLVERHGDRLRPVHLADALLDYLPYRRVFTAERAAMVNLLHNVPVDSVGQVRNPYREWIGALIRADVYGWTHPGRPAEAARLAYADAWLTHRANGLYGSIWAAALVSAAAVADSVRAALDCSLGFVPARSRLAEALGEVVRLHDDGAGWEEALAFIRTRYGHYSWVHTVNNACLITAGLLWGEGDFAATVGLTVQGGWDTDSNGATAGSVAGTVLGASRLPDRFVVPLRDRTRSAIFGQDGVRISALAERTRRAAERLAPAAS